jgi:hypothetical protein
MLSLELIPLLCIALQELQKQLLTENVALLDLGGSDSSNALHLFRQCTCTSPPTAEIAEMESAIIKACGGLPLALQLAGSRLFGCTDANRWKVCCCLHCVVLSELGSPAECQAHVRKQFAQVICGSVRG